MSPLRLVAIGSIFFFTTIAWMILGGTIVERTGESDGRLRHEVEMLWGSEHNQRAPDIQVQRVNTRRVMSESTKDGVVQREVREETDRKTLGATLTSTNVRAHLDLEHRKKGLLWWPTYAVNFEAQYGFTIPPPEEARPDLLRSVDVVTLTVPMSARGAVYDGFHVRVNGIEHPAVATADNTFEVHLPRSATTDAAAVSIAYRSRGLGTWQYIMGNRGASTQVQNFGLDLTTNVADVDFPIGTLSPSKRTNTTNGASMSWRFDSLVTGQNIGVELPARLNPGPVAARISFFAPVSLLFFMTVMVILGVVQKRSLHPMNYFFLAAAFFAFHLLFAYLVDVVALPTAFGISSVVSLVLVTSYLRLVQGAKTAFLQAGLAQLIFLVGFSLAFFHEGQTGLTVAIGSVVTLFVLMQLTARVRWHEVFGGRDPEEGPLGGAPVGVPGLGNVMGAKPSTTSGTSTSIGPKGD